MSKKDRIKHLYKVINFSFFYWRGTILISIPLLMHKDLNWSVNTYKWGSTLVNNKLRWTRLAQLQKLAHTERFIQVHMKRHMSLTQPQKIVHERRFVQIHIRRPILHPSIDVKLLNNITYINEFTTRLGKNISQDFFQPKK